MVRDTLVATLSNKVSDLPLSLPLPVQPLMLNALPPLIEESVRLAVVIPLRLSVVLGADNWLLASVKEPLTESVTVPVLPPGRTATRFPSSH